MTEPEPVDDSYPEALATAEASPPVEEPSLRARARAARNGATRRRDERRGMGRLRPPRSEVIADAENHELRRCPQKFRRKCRSSRRETPADPLKNLIQAHSVLAAPTGLAAQRRAPEAAIVDAALDRQSHARSGWPSCCPAAASAAAVNEYAKQLGRTHRERAARGLASRDRKRRRRPRCRLDEVPVRPSCHGDREGPRTVQRGIEAPSMCWPPGEPAVIKAWQELGDHITAVAKIAVVAREFGPRIGGNFPQIVEFSLADIFPGRRHRADGRRRRQPRRRQLRRSSGPTVRTAPRRCSGFRSSCTASNPPPGATTISRPRNSTGSTAAPAAATSVRTARCSEDPGAAESLSRRKQPRHDRAATAADWPARGPAELAAHLPDGGAGSRTVRRAPPEPPPETKSKEADQWSKSRPYVSVLPETGKDELQLGRRLRSGAARRGD